jgi:GNAT superfamily N-acetyltransferase
MFGVISLSALHKEEHKIVKQNLIVVGNEPEPEFEKTLSAGLNAFNDQIAGATDRSPLTVVVRDPETHEALGGIIGRTSLGLAFLDLFHLPEALRGSGLGSKVLNAFEHEARRRGCRSAVLYTISFQAPEFYEKNGWQRFGEIACDPEGASRVFMKKSAVTSHYFLESCIRWIFSVFHGQGCMPKT